MLRTFSIRRIWFLPAARVFVALWFVALLPVAAAGQTGTSTMSGLVRDESGGAVPGVVVQIVNEETGVAIDAVTNEEGLYRVTALVPGRYRVETRLDGFSPSIRNDVILQVSQSIAVDLTLTVASQTEIVQVRASALAVDATTSNVTQTVTREMLAALPLPNRAASSLSALAPGVVMIDTGAGTAENYPVFSVAGGRARNQVFLLDGGNATNAVGLTRQQQLTSLPVDAMQEFKVITNNYSAEFGHSTGGVITMTTRAGTNAFRGSIFESLRHDALDARNFFAQSKPPIRLNQFGGTFGGPAIKDRMFYFATWERTRQLVSNAVVSTVPTLANRRGDFSDLRTDSGEMIGIYDPLTGQPFPGNVIPQDRIDPVALKALGYYPEPNRAGTAANANNFVGNSDARLDRDIVMARVDHALSAADRLTARYYINDSGTEHTGSYGNPVADPLANTTDVRVQSLLGAYTRTFGPALANELRVTYLRRKFIDQRFGFGENLAATLGLRGVSERAFPAFTIPGYGSLSSANLGRVQTPILDRQVLESLSWFKGRHAFKFGFEARFGGNSEVRDRGSSGALSFSPLFTSNDAAAGTGNALATFLLGEVNSASVQISDQITTRAQYFAGFVQDDWRVNNRLTLNVGVRYDIELPRREVDNRQNTFDATALNPVSGTPGVVRFAGINGTRERAFATDVNNFGPRFGFAYQLTGTGRTVLRGGTGIFYGQTVDATIGDAASLGFSTQASFVVAQATTQSAFRLRDGFPAYGREELTDAFGSVRVGERPYLAVSFFNPEQVVPISYQTNVSLQHQFDSDLVVEVAYLSNESRHLTAPDFSLNEVAPHLVGPGDTQLVRPYPQFSNVSWINPSIGKSSYHGAFVRAQKRFSDSFSLLAHYTWSRYKDDVTAADEYGSNIGGYMDAYRRDLDWATSGSDVPHHFVATVLYEIPAFTAHPLLKGALSGWTLGLLQTVQSGAPFTVTTAANTTNAFPSGPLRPNLVGDPELPAGQRTVARWFNTAAFQNPAPFTFGSSPRSVLRGPQLITTDLTVERAIRLSGPFRLDVRAEAYNLLNRTNFTIPGSTLGAADFGVMSTARPARTIQLGARLSF
ncbi:MAG TPA: carboxypeptidase regulatory-like domain-containing protein [Vicinamibacterales bacterium]